MRLTIQQKERYEKLKLLNAAIQKMPLEYQVRQSHKYPPDNDHEFERWFFDNVTTAELIGKERTYLPVFWTAYWCNNGYGKKTGAARRLQHFINELPRTKKYWTICQYDDGCMVDFKDLDIKIFGMSGGRIDYPIPLLCCPHKFEFPNVKKDIFCSFIGSDTHPIRRELVKEFKGKPDCMVEIKKLPLKDYCEVLARSVFALAPRGYGLSSFRIQEAINYNAIPVYISDKFIIPYYRDLVLHRPPETIAGLYESLMSFNLATVYPLEQTTKHLFTYQGCKEKILENI